MIYAGFASVFGCGVEGQSCSNFLASTVEPAPSKLLGPWTPKDVQGSLPHSRNLLKRMLESWSQHESGKTSTSQADESGTSKA